MLANDMKEDNFKPRNCVFYNNTDCLKGQDCFEKQSCGNKGNDCFALWKYDENGETIIQFKGCWFHASKCTNSACVASREIPFKGYYFCCCSADMCNDEMSVAPLTQTETQLVPSQLETSGPEIFYILLYTLVPLLLLTILIAIAYWFYRQKKLTYFNELSTETPTLPLPSPLLSTRPLHLLEVKAHGRFGAVWKAQHKTGIVAVKVFPLQDRQSWVVEQEIYRLPQMAHENILEFIGSDKQDNRFRLEYWLITAYHSNGSLSDYLKANTVTFSELCRIVQTVSAGLTHIHEEIPAPSPTSYKPAIAHRDFKSKNVLLKSDLTACIADFGLALVFYPGRNIGDTHGQVGTRRYMAPEVLEGAINFSRDAFLRIDMYAAALVLWEVVSRCSAHNGSVGEYKLPFEEEIGQHPTLEDIQDLVVHRKARPIIKEHWKHHPGLNLVCDTIVECWDQDGEARLTASCVKERSADLTNLHWRHSDQTNAQQNLPTNYKFFQSESTI